MKELNKIGSYEEDKEMMEIIHNNKKVVRKAKKVNKIKTQIVNIALTVSVSIAFIGLLYLINVIENLKF